MNRSCLLIAFTLFVTLVCGCRENGPVTILFTSDSGGRIEPVG